MPNVADEDRPTLDVSDPVKLAIYLQWQSGVLMRLLHGLGEIKSEMANFATFRISSEKNEVKNKAYREGQVATASYGMKIMGGLFLLLQIALALKAFIL